MGYHPENGNSPREEIIAAGFGGQGIMLLGKLLATAGMNEGREVTYLPSYGAEVRGGTAHCFVVISSEKIASPVIVSPVCAIVMNHPSLVKFEPKIITGGTLIANSSLMLSQPERTDIETIMIPATEIAKGIGSLQIANMIMLGCYLANREALRLETILTALKEVIPARHHNLLAINRTAIKKGYEFIASKDMTSVKS